MAFYDITTEYKNLLDHGLTDEQILKESGIESNRLVTFYNHKTGEFGDAQVGNRSSEARWATYYANRIERLEAEKAEADQDTDTTEKPAEVAANAPLATEKQTALIMKLIGQGKHLEGGYFSGPTTHQEVAKMTRKNASRYIDSLLGRY